MLSLHPFYIPRRLESTGSNSDCQRVFAPATPYSPYLSPMGRGRGKVKAPGVLRSTDAETVATLFHCKPRFLIMHLRRGILCFARSLATLTIAALTFPSYQLIGIGGNCDNRLPANPFIVIFQSIDKNSQFSY